MFCPYCGKVAYWYEVKVEGQKPKEHACCEQAKSEGLKIHTKMMKDKR